MFGEKLLIAYDMVHPDEEDNILSEMRYMNKYNKRKMSKKRMDQEVLRGCFINTICDRPG